MSFLSFDQEEIYTPINTIDKKEEFNTLLFNNDIIKEYNDEEHINKKKRNDNDIIYNKNIVNNNNINQSPQPNINKDKIQPKDEENNRIQEIVKSQYLKQSLRVPTARIGSLYRMEREKFKLSWDDKEDTSVLNIQDKNSFGSLLGVLQSPSNKQKISIKPQQQIQKVMQIPITKQRKKYEDIHWSQKK